MLESDSIEEGGGELGLEAATLVSLLGGGKEIGTR